MVETAGYNPPRLVPLQTRRQLAEQANGLGDMINRFGKVRITIYPR